MGWKELGIFLGVLVVWFTLNRWVLPWFGINTCMSGACAVDSRPAATEGAPEATEQEGDMR